MSAAPEVRYTKAPDGTHIAYQSFGGGAFDLFVFVGGWTHLRAAQTEADLSRREATHWWSPLLDPTPVYSDVSNSR